MLNCFSLFRPGTTIAAAVGGVVLFFILLALLVFYLKRQNKLKRKETMRRILQEHEVGTNVLLFFKEKCQNLNKTCASLFKIKILHKI